MKTRGLTILRTPTGSEPVTLEELKLHLSIDFDDHDDLLNILLKSAREEVEIYTGLSLVDSDIKVRWESVTIAELPYGPVKSVTESASYNLEGLMGSFVSVNDNTGNALEIEYKTGYTSVPTDLKLAIMKLATDNFEQRAGISFAGTNAFTQMPNDWRKTAAKFSRKTWLG